MYQAMIRGSLGFRELCVVAMLWSNYAVRGGGVGSERREATVCGQSVAGYFQPRRGRILIPARWRRLATVWGSRSCWLGDLRERMAFGIRVGGCRERVIVPLLGDTAALHLATVEVGHHGGAADAEAFGELHDRGAGVVVVDEGVDSCGAQSGLRAVPCRRWGSLGVASGWLLAARCRLGV